MFSSTNWKPNPQSVTQGFISHYVGKANAEHRQRTSTEEFIRTLTCITPATTILNTSTEVVELWAHKDRKAQITMNNIITDRIKDETLARDIVFDRCANRIP